MPVQKVPNSWGELKNLEPAAYGTSDIPDTPVPFDPGIPERQFVPGDWGKWDTWQQMLLQLKDVPFPALPADIGKSIVLRPTFDESSGYSVSWEIPANSETADRLTNPRSFSITGDGTASPVAFDGTANVVLNITNAQAAKWTNPRTVTFTGAGVTGSFALDGSANVSAELAVGNAATASRWATARTVTITGADAAGNFSIDGSANVNFPVTVNQAPKWTTARTLSLTGNATGSVFWDGSANASIAVNVNQAANATNAGTAATANAVANGAITVTLTGDVTGTASISGGTVTVATTATGSGGGSGPDGQTQFGNSTQYWGTGLAAGVNAELIVTFPTPFINDTAYSVIAIAEANNTNIAVSVNVAARTANDVTLRVGSDAGPQNLRVNYIIVGQTIP